jgi:hypothetical protein
MHILLADETNKEPSKDAQFFVYGGIMFQIDKLPILDWEIEKIRQASSAVTFARPVTTRAIRL